MTDLPVEDNREKVCVRKRYIRRVSRSRAGGRDEAWHSDETGAWHAGAGFPRVIMPFWSVVLEKS
jgi:hypothetical protein